MTKSPQLTGRVLNASGEAIAGADIVALSDRIFPWLPIDVELSEGNGYYRTARSAVTDADGRFTFRGDLQPGKVLSVSIIAEGYAPLRLSRSIKPVSRRP